MNGKNVLIETYDYKRVAQRKLLKEYGFAPCLKDIEIVIARCNHDFKYVSYIMFAVNGHTYDYVKNNNCEYVKKRD